MPKKVERGSKALGFSPFDERIVGKDSARYNEGQLLDAMLKIEQGLPLNQEFRGPRGSAERDKRIQGKAIDNSGTRDIAGNLPPKYLEESGGINPITEQQAWDEFIALHGAEAEWANPENFQRMSQVRLAEIKEKYPEKYQAAVQRYDAYLRGKNTQYNVLPFLGTQEGLRVADKGARKFNKALGITPLERTGQSKGSTKFKTLTDNNRNAIIETVKDMEGHMKGEGVSFLSEVDEEGDSLQSNIEKMEEDLGVDSSNRRSFSSVATLSLASITSIFKKHKYNKQAIADYLGSNAAVFDSETEQDEWFDDDLAADELLEGRGAGGDERISSEESLANLKEGVEYRHRQPILHGLMTNIDKFIKERMNPNGRTVEGSDSLIGAGGLLRYWTEQGHISWGRTKKGYVIPIINNDVGLGNLSETELMVAFNPELRTRKFSTTQAANFPLGGNYNIDEIGKDWTTLLRPGVDYKGRSGISESFLTMMQNIRYSIDGDRLWFADQMHKEVDQDWLNEASTKGFVEGSSHPYAATFGGIGTNDYDTYARKDKKALEKARGQGDQIERPKAADLVFQHKKTLANKIKAIIERYQEQVTEKVGYYVPWHKSPNTGRYYMDEELFNIINDKGVMRNLVNLGNMIPIALKGDKSVGKYLSDPRGTLYPEVEALFSKGLPKGINWGQTIQQRLKALDPATRQLMGFYYALGHMASKYRINEPAGQTKKVDVSNHQKAISHGMASFEAIADIGNKFRKYKEQGALPKHEALSPIEREILTGKGDWGSALSIVLDASRFKESVKKKSATFNFKFVFQEDSQQSNVMLISAFTGDFSMGRLLGMLPDLENDRTDPETGEAIPASNFRELLVYDIDKRTKTILNNTEDEKYADALSDYFKEVLSDTSINGTKVITRGLQIATAYGKYAGYLYEEAEDMLDQTPKQRKILYDLYNAEDNKEGTERLIRDISQVYLNIANETMANVMGYQKTVKSVGQAIKTLNGPTEIPGAFPGESVNFGISELTDVDESQFIAEETKGITKRLGGWLFPELKKRKSALSAAPSVRNRAAMQAYQNQIDQAADPKNPDIRIAMQGSPETEVFEFGDYLQDAQPEEDGDGNVIPFTGRRSIKSAPYGKTGSQIVNAMPVDIIQNMDSLMMAMSFLIAGSSDITKGKKASELTPEELAKVLPPAATAIHDAIYSTADSVLLLNNAYNNIAPHVIARGARNFIERLDNLVKKNCFEPILKKSDKDIINIGTQSRIADPSSYPGITAYFDEIYLNLQKSFYEGKPEQAKRKRIVDNQEIENPDTGKPMTNEEWSNKLQDIDRKFLIQAEMFGYKSPLEKNRERYSVTGGQLKALTMLFMEREGLLTETSRKRIRARTNPEQTFRGEKGKQVMVPMKDEDGKIKEKGITLYNLSNLQGKQLKRSIRNGVRMKRWLLDSTRAAEEMRKQNSTNTNLKN